MTVGLWKLLLLLLCSGSCILRGFTAHTSARVVPAQLRQPHERVSALGLMKSHHPYIRVKRETIENDAFYDDSYDHDEGDGDNENADVIPEMTADAQQRLDVRLKQHADEIAESFRKMWQSMAESVNHGIAALRQIFGDADAVNGVNTPPEDKLDNEIPRRDDGYRRV